MKYIKGSYSKYSKLYNIIFFIISISITLGLITSFCLNKDLISNIYEYITEYIINFSKNNISTLLYPIIIYAFVFLISLTIVGSILPFIILLLENMSIGLVLGVLLRKASIKGFLFGIIYFILTKFIYIIILIYLIISIYKFIRSITISIKTKNNSSIYSLYSKIILKFLFSIIIILLYNLINIFITPKIIKMFIFLI